MVEELIASLGQTFFAASATTICLLLFVVVAWRVFAGTSKEDARNLANIPFSDDALDKRESNNER